MIYQEFFDYVKNAGKDPSYLVFEDELTGLHNRRFLLNYLQHKISWDALADYHVSLLMMDIDYFKTINDLYGHDSGDDALVHAAGILKDVCGEEGIPVRYGGDEFIVLLSGQAKEAALATGQKLVAKFHERPLRLKEGQAEITISVSIGIAEAPADAESGTVLIQKADTALYNAKQAGRDRVCDAAKAVYENVFPKIAIHQLANMKMAGREFHLAQVKDAIMDFSNKKSRFLIVEGAGGMGKSAFLREVQRNLDDSKILQVKVFGSPQELFRPYYLISDLIVELMSRREDKGMSVIDSLGPEDLKCISFVLPSLGDNVQAPELKEQREGIFRFLVRLVNELADTRPLMVFADDLQFADEASLIVLRATILQNRFPLFICGATSDAPPGKADNPLLSFWHAYNKELEIKKIVLTPLSEKDIAEHLEKMFPAIIRPANFEKEVYEITKGNPLFISEILNKLIHDRMIVFTDQRWAVRHIDPAYFSASLDQVVTEIIGSFDDDTKRILNYASIFGESVPLSMLRGFSEDEETRILDFLDKAKAYGLVISDLHDDDEIIRFLSKRIQTIVYSGIDQDVKKELHDKIAHYQERLFEQKVLPSAAVLAWHFERSANIEKFGIYDQLQREYSATVFHADEAAQYSLEQDGSLPDIPLDPQALKDLWLFFRSFLIAVSGIKLYPAGNMARTNAVYQVKNILDRIFVNCSRIRVAVEKDCLIVNGETIDITDARPTAESICSLFAGIDLNSISIRKDFSRRDLENMLEAIGLADSRKIHPQYWEDVCSQRGLESVELKQLRYAKVEEEKTGHDESDPVHHLLPEDLSGQAHIGEGLSLVAPVVTTLMGALSKIRLYPPESSVMTDAIDQVMAALAAFLEKTPVLNMTVVDTSVLVNGIKIDTQGFKSSASNFISFMQSSSLDSISFIKIVSSVEVLSFLSMTAKQPEAEMNADFWRDLERKKEFRGILFNRSVYTVFNEMAAGYSEQQPTDENREPDLLADNVNSPAAAVDQGVQKLFKAEDLAGILRDLLLCDREEEFSSVLERTFKEYSLYAPAGREKILEVFEKVASERFVVAPKYLRLTAGQLQKAFRQETESAIIERLYRLLQHIAFLFLNLGEFTLAGWVFFTLRERVRELKDGENDLRENLQALKEPLPPSVIDGLREGLKSPDLSRRQQAVQFLSEIDDRVLPCLAELVKQENDLQARRFSAGMIKNLGTEAIEIFKRDLVLELSVDEQVRLLDAADMVTDDLQIELRHALESENSAVQRAAFLLAERLNDEPTLDLLCSLAQEEFSDKTILAIRALGRMKAGRSVPALIGILDGAKRQEIQSACCRALGKIADPAAADILIRILTTRGILTTQKKYADNIRAVAAYALAQISHPRVMEVMKSLAEDANPLVRQTARAAVKRGTGAM